MEFNSFFFFVMFSCLFLLFLQPASSFWVSSRNNSLYYTPTSSGDRIMDFSPVGYNGRDGEIPKNVPVLVTVSPSGKDNDGFFIQEAINKVSSSPLNPSTGFRGAIQLTDGNFTVKGFLFNITSSGVVIKGSPNTVLYANVSLAADGAHENPLFHISSPDERVTESGSRASIISTVPSGSDYVTVSTTAGLKYGDLVQIVWPQTQKWMKMMNMVKRWGNSSATRIERRVTRIDGAKVFLNVQVPFRIDLAYLDSVNFAYIVKINVSGRVSRVGLQGFKAMQDKVLPHGRGSFLTIGSVENSWVKDVTAVDFGGDTVTLAGQKITVDNLRLIKTTPGHVFGPKPADIAIQFPGSQILVKNSFIEGDTTEFTYITRNGANGPNVFFNCSGNGRGHAEAHAHFASGTLYDNMKLEQGAIGMVNRPYINHGYGAAYSVAWNCKLAGLKIVNPPQAANWAIGCQTKVTEYNVGNETLGNIDAGGIESEKLSSLYLAQKAGQIYHF